MGTNIYARLHPDNQERKKLALKIKDAIMTNEPDMYYQIENILDKIKAATTLPTSSDMPAIIET